MRKCLFALFALSLLAGSTVVRCQSSAGDDSVYSQNPNDSVNCADPLYATSEECAQSQQQPRQYLPEATGMGNVRSTGTTASTAPENVPLGANTLLLVQQRALPPDLPTEFQKFVAATTGQLLPIYGADLFRNVPSTFSPNDLAPVTPDYVIGPNDELRVRIWGQINYSGNLRVDRSGDIYLSQVGAVHVAGLPFSALDQHLRAAVGKIFRNFDLSVDVGQIRSMQIFVTGEARRPGAYTVSSLSSLVDTLFASGGPSPQGSLRHIQIKRDGKIIADFDLYALLLHGDKSKDVRLLPEDVLYIPPVGAQVAITGSIRIPAIYELSGNETIRDVVDAAGRTSAVASNTRISLDRVDEHQLRRSMEIAFDEAGQATPVADGDILRIFPILPAYRKTVTLRGNVANPGRFGWYAGMHLSALIPDRDSLLSRDYWWKRSHLGLPAPEFESEISSIGEDRRFERYRSLGQNRQAGQNQQIGQNQPIGQNQQGGEYQPSLQSNAGNFTTSVTQDTLTAALEANRQQDSTAVQEESQENTAAGSSGSLATRSTREPLGGAPAEPQKNEVRLSPLEIVWNYAVIERLDPETLKTSLIPFDLGKLVLNHDSSQDLALEPGDTVTIFSQADIRQPIEQQTKYVSLEGEFVHAGIYSVKPGETLRDLVVRAGGITDKAYLYGSEFTRESTRILQQQRINEYVRTVSMDAERGTQALAVTGGSSGSSSEVSAAQAATQQMLARLSQVRATGRVVLQFHPDSKSVQDVPALALENGDHFTVPSMPATVNVVGAVYDQNSFISQKGKPVAYYLRLAGGANRNADARRSFVIRADGSVVSRSNLKSSWSIWDGDSFAQVRLNPGDTIVVPDKTLRPTALRNVLDWTQVFSQLALGAAAINVL